MVVKPIISYATTVWWPGVTHKTSRTILNQLQRISCLKLTGAMKMAPIAAIEIILGLLPFHMKIEAVVEAASYRISCNE
jgi:hypothetical protein